MAVLSAGIAASGGLTAAAESVDGEGVTDGCACCVPVVEGAVTVGGTALEGMTSAVAGGAGVCVSGALTGRIASLGIGVETIEELLCAGGTSGRAGGVTFARTTGLC